MLTDFYGGVYAPPPLETNEPTARQWRDAFEASAMQLIEMRRLLKFEDSQVRTAREQVRALEERALAAERASVAAYCRGLVAGAVIGVSILTTVIEITRRHG